MTSRHRFAHLAIGWLIGALLGIVALAAVVILLFAVGAPR
jgi:hypothetical protein